MVTESPRNTLPEDCIAEALETTTGSEDPGIEAFVFLLMEVGKIRPAHSILKKVLQVRHVGIYTGGRWDIVARIGTKSLDEMGTVFLDHIQTIDGIVKSKLDFVIG